MLQVDVRVRLKDLQVRRRNESSPDEPFLWVIGIRFDGETLGNFLLEPEQAELAFHTPPGRHGNLGAKFDDVDHSRPQALPASQGVWDTRLRFDPDANFSEIAPLSTLAIVVVALEEDGTADSYAIEAHRRIIAEVKTRLTATLRAILTEARDQVTSGGQLPSGAQVQDRLREALNPEVITRVIDELRDELIPGKVVRGIFNLFTLPAAIANMDADDLVGFSLADFSMPRLIGTAMDGIEIAMNLNKDLSMARVLESFGAELSDEVRERFEDQIVRSDDGHYVISGLARRTDLLEPPTIGSTWQAGRVRLFARGNDRRVLANAVDGAAATDKWRALGAGVLTSGISAAASPGGGDLFVVGRGTDDAIWLARAGQDLASAASAGWSRLPPFKSRLGAGVCYAPEAKRLHVFAVAEDKRVHWSWSRDKGESWTLPWGYLGTGLLDSTPAAAITPDGKHLNVFGIGTDRRIWRAYSEDGGVNWNHLWSLSELPAVRFDSAPACAISANGKRLFLCAKAGGRYSVIRSDDYGRSWRGREWTRLGRPEIPGFDTADLFFISAPTVCASPDLDEVHVSGICSDMRMYSRVFRGDQASPWYQVHRFVFA